MSIAEGLQAYYDVFGVRGLLAISSFRVFGVPCELAALSPKLRYAVSLRVRTSDVALFRDIVMRDEYRIDAPDFSPKTIVDAGANVGIASVYYANKFPDAHIVAVEPEPGNYAALVQNTSHYKNIRTINAAIWNRDGQINLTSPLQASRSSEKWGFYVHNGDGIKVRAMTMQSLMAEMKLESIDLLKMDVEGAEKEIFDSCDWISRVQLIVIELHDRIKPGCSAAITLATKQFTRRRSGELTILTRENSSKRGLESQP